MSETRRETPVRVGAGARRYDRSPAELKAVIAAEHAGSPFLVWRGADRRQRILPLGLDRWRVTIGRDPTADVSLAGDAEVSRAHAVIERVGQGWTLVDDGLSRNGSFVNGSRVLGRHRLHDRDRMCFGNTPVVFREPTSGRGSESTARAPESTGDLHLSEMQRKVLIALCRPIAESSSATPATNPQIATEIFLSVDAVKAHLRILFERFGLGELPQNEKRTRLVSVVLGSGLLAPRDF
jgi:DNA-binding CsgD family transcriptional regulator